MFVSAADSTIASELLGKVRQIGDRGPRPDGDGDSKKKSAGA